MDGKLSHALDEMVAAEIPWSSAKKIFAEAYVEAALRATKYNRTAAGRLIAMHRNQVAKIAGPKFPKRRGVLRVRRTRHGDTRLEVA